MKPYEQRYENSTDRLLARLKTGQLTEEEFTVRLARVRARRDEQAAKWDRADRWDARTDYWCLTPDQKVRARLAFRANRPRVKEDA